MTLLKSMLSASLRGGKLFCWLLTTALATTSALACEDPFRCFAVDKFNDTIGDFAHYVDKNGKRAFGDNFSVVSNLSYSRYDNFLGGDMDAVIPMSFFTSAEERPGRAFFFQSGLTRWKDVHDFRRDDFRQGVAYRFAISDDEDTDVAGMWAFIQNNKQRGHARFAWGGDYATSWGTAKFYYFIPQTNWRAGRHGYEEKALEGGDALMEFDAFRRFSFNIGAGRWEKKDGSEKFNAYGRLGVGWQILPVLSLDSQWRGFGKSDDSLRFNAQLEIPLGRMKPGYAAPRHSLPAAANLYRAITTPRRIEVAERKIAVRSPIDGVTVRFMQDSANSGARIMLEVLLPKAVDKDSEFFVQLVPGEGPNSAVAGVDFDGTPIPMTVKKGESRGIVFAFLLFNENQTRTRTLAAKVYSTS